MKRWKPISEMKPGFLPERFIIAHDYSFILHDIMAETLRSGEQNKIFTTDVVFDSEEEIQEFKNADDSLVWLSENKKHEEIFQVIINAVYPALLSDFLHFIYEALISSRKAKLSVAYALIRKPIQENLFLIEEISYDPVDFTKKLIEDPLQLRGKKLGSIENQTKRIDNILRHINQDNWFSAEYIAKLRYDKSVEDSFDGICNLAMHLFTSNKHIKTESLNINFIFSGFEEKTTQWDYLYSRLPYLLLYAFRLIEYSSKMFAKTPEDYLLFLEKKVCALSILWFDSIPEDYKNSDLEKISLESKSWMLTNKCFSKNTIDTPSLIKYARATSY